MTQLYHVINNHKANPEASDAMGFVSSLRALGAPCAASYFTAAASFRNALNAQFESKLYTAVYAIECK